MGDNDNPFNIVEPNFDRRRGTLTPHDRRFLHPDTRDEIRKGEPDENLRQKRYKIRRRFEHALLDWQYLLMLTENEDLLKILDHESWEEKITEEKYDEAFSGVTLPSFFLLRTKYNLDAVIHYWGLLLQEDVQNEYLQDHDVFVPQSEIELDLKAPEPEECEPLDSIRERILTGEDVPQEAHNMLRRVNRHPEDG